MKRIVLWLGSTTVAVALLLGYHTSTNSSLPSKPRTSVLAAGVVAPTTAANPDPARSRTPPAAKSPAKATGPVPATSAPKAPNIITVNGGAANTRYGAVQVQIVVKSGHLTAVRAVSYATEGRSGEINASAIPQLEAAALRAQSAGIDTVSGATYTSGGFKESLQSALDAVHL